MSRLHARNESSFLPEMTYWRNVQALGLCAQRIDRPRSDMLWTSSQISTPRFVCALIVHIDRRLAVNHRPPSTNSVRGTRTMTIQKRPALILFRPGVETLGLETSPNVHPCLGQAVVALLPTPPNGAIVRPSRLIWVDPRFVVGACPW